MSRQMIMQMIVGCSRFVCVFVFENTYWPVLRRGIVSIGVCVEVYGQQWAKRADPGCFIFYNSSFILSLSNCSGACAAEVSQHLSAVWILWFSFLIFFSFIPWSPSLSLSCLFHLFDCLYVLFSFRPFSPFTCSRLVLPLKISMGFWLHMKTQGRHSICTYRKPTKAINNNNNHKRIAGS